MFRETKCNFIHTIRATKTTQKKWRHSSDSEDELVRGVAGSTSDSHDKFIPDNAILIGTEDGK